MKRIELSAVSEGVFKLVVKNGLFKKKTILFPKRFPEAVMIAYTELTGKDSHYGIINRVGDLSEWSMSIQEPNDITAKVQI